MTKPVHTSGNCIVFDACCAINLSASGHFASILESLHRRVAIARYIVEREILQDGAKADVLAAISSGILELVSPNGDAESDLYVEFAAMKLGNGEAMSGALALHRDWALATDDTRAINVFRAKIPQVEIVTTPDMLYLWSTGLAEQPDVISSALTDVRTRARYEPPDGHPLRTWWHSNLK